MKAQPNLMQKAKAPGLHALILLMGFSLSISSCKKKDTTPNVKYVYEDDLYIAGYYTKNSSFYPAYWENGNKVELKVDGVYTVGSVNAITVSGTDVYAVGSSGSNSNVTLWKNGEAIKVTQDGEKSAHAQAITVSNGQVYIAGYQMQLQTNSAVYWQVEPNKPPASIVLNKLGNMDKHNVGSAIAVLNGKVYTAGYANNASINQAVLWTGKIPAILGSSTSSFGQGIAVSGNDLYIGGIEDNTVTYWKNDGSPAVAVGTLKKSNTGLNCITINENKVYMAGSDYSGSSSAKAVYWNGNTPVPLITGIASTYESAVSVAVAGNNIYVTGEFASALTGIRSILWANGKKVPGFDGSQDIRATALFVVKK
jgi:hypothetical protein